MLRNGPLELFGVTTLKPCDTSIDPWSGLVAESSASPYKDAVCPFKKMVPGMYSHTGGGVHCDKIRKAQPNPLIGNCSVRKTKAAGNIQDWIVCPSRFLQNATIFRDCKKFLMPCDSYRVVRELAISAEGNLDFGLTALDSDAEVIDFVGIEVQACGTGGSGPIWTARNDFLKGKMKDSYNFSLNEKDASKKILVQLLHKARQIARWRKNTVLVIQDHFLEHLRRSYNIDGHFHDQDINDFIHIHSYSLREKGSSFELVLNECISTDMVGLSMVLISNPNIQSTSYDTIESAIARRFKEGKFEEI